MVAPQPLTKQGRVLVVNSTLAFVLAAMVNATLHELAHLAAALSQQLSRPSRRSRSTTGLLGPMGRRC